MAWSGDRWVHYSRVMMLNSYKSRYVALDDSFHIPSIERCEIMQNLKTFPDAADTKNLLDYRLYVLEQVVSREIGRTPLHYNKLIFICIAELSEYWHIYFSASSNGVTWEITFSFCIITGMTEKLCDRLLSPAQRISHNRCKRNNEEIAEALLSLNSTKVLSYALAHG